MNLEEMVRPSQGIVSRKIFSDPQIYELELKNIFSKVWLYVAHESQIKHEGDYITTYMGNEPIIVCRDHSNKIRVFLNSCRHRGMRICRSEAGNTSFFRCPYHGWTYSNDGRLVGVPRYKTAYFEELPKEKWGLYEAKHIVNFHGMIWATWNENPPSFDGFLGDMKFYLDLLFERYEDNVEVYRGTQKWIIQTNWKFPADNFAGDSYHASSAHQSAVELGLRAPYSDNDFEINIPGGHGFGGQKGGMGKAIITSKTHVERTEKNIEVLANKYGEFVKEIMPMGHVGIFPNFSILDLWNYTTFRIWHPIGPTTTMVESGIFVYSDLDEKEKTKIFQRYIFEFGPGGIFEQDDAEIWHECTLSSLGMISRELEFNYQAGLNHDESAEKIFGKGAKGRAGTPFSEINQRDFYRTWLSYMRGEK